MYHYLLPGTCRKPAPDVYLETARGLRVSPEDCLVFEDVPMGILAGKRAGMKVCAVEDTFSKKTGERKKETGRLVHQGLL